MISLAIANQKGGVGKTSTAAALGGLLAGGGLRVLLADLDPQASLTMALGVDPAGRSLAEVITGSMPAAAAIHPVSDRLAILPSDISLAGAELALVERLGRELVLKRALAGLSDFDICLIDCPPSLGMMTVNGLCAARGVIVPTLPSATDLRGVRLFLDTLERVKDLNPGLQLLGVLLVQFEPRLNAHNQAQETLKAAGVPMLGTIPRSVRVAEAAGAKKPITDYDPGSKPAQAYQELARKVKQWLRKNQT